MRRSRKPVWASVHRGFESPPLRLMKTWFITGCSTGLGRAFAQAALAAGYNVVATARDAAKLAELASEYPETAMTASLDVTDERQVKDVTASAIQRFGAIDVLVNNAGYGYR